MSEYPVETVVEGAPAPAAEMARLAREHPLFQAVMATVDGYLVIMNERRQILAANQQFMRDFTEGEIELVTGRRPGEVLRCVHTGDGPDGCGSGRACDSCGALGTILASQREGRPCTGECLATLREHGRMQAREFRVRATPLEVEGHAFTVLVLSDISGDKRREALERTFFHDILNTLGGLQGWCHLLQEMGTPETRRVVDRIALLSNRLQDEIEDQRRLSQAERGRLAVNRKAHAVGKILGVVETVFELHESGKGRLLEVCGVEPEETVTTDLNLLLRVLENMVKNAMEAVEMGERVRLWFEREGEMAVFRVHNPGTIEARIQPRIFERFYSTKPEPGRGIGTYSMKLFGERYLGGKVGFETRPETGTVFYIKLPAAGK